MSGLHGQLSEVPEPWMARGAGGCSEEGPRTGPTERCPGEIPEPGPTAGRIDPDLRPRRVPQRFHRSNLHSNPHELR